MIENRMVIDSEWPEEDWDDPYEDNGTEDYVMDCLFETDNVHLFMEHYLDVEDLEEKEIQCQEIFEAMSAKYPVMFHDAFREWMVNKTDMIRDIFNEWWRNR